MMDELKRQADGLRDLDAVLTRLEAKVDALPSRLFIVEVLVQAVRRAALTATAIGAAIAVATLIWRWAAR